MSIQADLYLFYLDTFYYIKKLRNMNAYYVY